MAWPVGWERGMAAWDECHGLSSVAAGLWLGLANYLPGSFFAVSGV